MINIIFLAPPAAGKGTQSELLSQKYNIPHISTGDLLREEVKKGTELGDQIKEIINKGELISDKIVNNLINERLNMPDVANGYILDGYPRTLVQAHTLDEILKKINKPLNYVFYLKIGKDVALKRTCGRLTCGNCNSMYNTSFKDSAPKQEMICDKCGGALFKRNDDTEETFVTRYDNYIEQTEPVVKHYEKKGILFYVDSSINKNITFHQIESAIDVPNIKNDKN